MKIARVIDGVVTEVGEHTALFPNTSFPGEPNDAFLAENSCLKVYSQKSYDLDQQRLETVAPYIEAGEVFTVTVVQLTDDELAANKAAALQVKEDKRAAAYREESDPLFFKAQRNEIDIGVWLAKVFEIKARY